MKFTASNLCTVCGKTKGYRASNHANCSKILQKQFAAKNTSGKLTARAVDRAFIEAIAKVAA